MLAWDDLRFVLAVAEGGSLSQAARHLKVSHPTVYRRIDALEKQLGTRLFERRPDGYVVTAAGEEARALAERLREDVSALENRLAGHDIRPSGVVRVTTTDTIADHLIPPVLATLRREHPGILVEVIVTKEALSLTRREADIAIRPTSTPPESLVGRKIGPLNWMISGAAARFPDGLPLQDFAAQDWIGFDDSLSHLPAARWLAAKVPATRIIYRSNEISAVWGAARAGLGLALLPTYMPPGRGTLLHGPAIPELESGLWLLTHRDLRQVPRIRTVINTILQSLKGSRLNAPPPKATTPPS